MKIPRSSSATIKRTVLANGITVLSERAKGFRTLSIGVWVRTGSRHERKHQAGMAHFLEHMLFKGTENYSALDIARAVDLAGGDFNAMTAREYTCFHITLPVRQLRFALELLTELVLNSKFESEEITLERKVVLQEYYAAEETPEEFIYDQFMEKAFPKHPLGQNILGTIKNIKHFQQKEVQQFFRQHYASENMIVAVAGNVEHQKIVQILRKGLGKMPAKKTVIPQTSRKLPKFSPGTTIMDRSFDQCHLLLGFEAFAIDHKDRLALYLLNAFLGGGMSSALFQSVREQNGLAYSIYSSLLPFRDCGALTMYVATSAKLMDRCMGLMRDELAKLQSNLMSEEDLRIVKNSIKSAVDLSSDAMESRMFGLARAELFLHRYYSNDEIAKLIDKVTPQQIQSVACSLFQKKPRTLALGKFSATQKRQIRW